MTKTVSFFLHRIGKLGSKTLMDTGYKFFRIKRLGKIIVRTKLETLQTVGLITTVGKKEYEYMLIRLADTFGNFKAIVTGHINIK